MASNGKVKPRPRAHKAAPAPVASSSRAKTDADDDAFFIKNRNRTTRTWKELEKRAEIAEKKLPRDYYGEYEQSKIKDELTRREKSLYKAKHAPLPRWTDPDYDPNVLLISSDEGRNSEEDVQVMDARGSQKNSQHHDPNHKRKRRSRSRSITPPAQVPQAHLADVRNVVRAVIGETLYRLPSPPAFEGHMEEEIVYLNPELAAIAKSVKNSTQTQKASSTDPNSTVTVNINWIPRPDDQMDKARRMTSLMKRMQPFSELLKGIAKTLSLRPDEIVLTLNGNKVYGASTPSSLKIWTETEIDGCTIYTHEYLSQQKKERLLSPVDEQPQNISMVLRVDPQGRNAQAAAEVSEDDDGDTFKLTLRSGSTTPVTLTVRPTTKCKAIVAAFLKKVGSTGAKAARNARLQIDGEKMNPEAEISVAELEDGDVVDVVGI